MIGATITLLGIATALACALTLAVRTLSLRLALADTAGVPGHRKQLRQVPNTGGVAIFLTIATPLAAVLLAAKLTPNTLAAIAPAEAAPHIAGVAEVAPLAWSIIAALTFLHITGLIDDRAALPAVPKLLIMLAPCIALPAAFPEARLLTILGPELSITATAAWLVVITNAVNFTDNMDGLAGSISAVAATLLAVFALATGQWFIAGLAALTAGAALGFLAFNAPPATIFMGDAGSLVLGFTLAILTVLASYTQLEPGSTAPTLRDLAALATPIALLAVPLYDFCSVVLIRIAQGKSPLVGDQQHFSHRLRNRGLTDAAVMATVAGLSFVCGASALALTAADEWAIPVIAAQVPAALAVLALLERSTTRAKP